MSKAAQAAQAALAAIALTAAACSSGSAPVVAPTTTTPPATTAAPTTTTLSQEEQVRAAYLAYWHMVDRLFAAPDPDDPEIALRAVDPVLSSVRDDLATRRTEGRSTRVPTESRYEHEARLAALDGHSATVHDCFVDDRVQVSSDGTLLNDRVSTIAAETTLTSDGTWRVSDVRTERLGDSSVACA